jgi:hypothetical protein
MTFLKLSHWEMYSTSLSKARNPEADSTSIPLVKAIYPNRLQTLGQTLGFIA